MAQDFDNLKAYNQDDEDNLDMRKKRQLAGGLPPAESATPSASPAEAPAAPGVDSSMKEEDIHSLASKLKSPSSQAFLEQMGKVANDPKYAAAVPADTQADLKKALADAKDLYTQRATQNDWLEVAQTLGRAVAQFGAASSMGNKANMSNLNMGAPIDYGARSDRALREYTGDVGAAKDLAANARQNSQDEQQRQRFELGRQQDFLDKGLKATTEEERFGTSEANAKARADTAERGQNLRQSLAEKAAEARQEAANKQLTAKDIDADLKHKIDQYQAAQKLEANTQLLEDVSTKDADKIQQSYGADLGKAGLSLSDIQARKPGMLWGTNPDPDKTKANLHSAVQGIKKEIDSLKAQKASLLGKGPAEAAPAAQPAAAPAGKIRVKQKASGQTGTIDPADFDPNKYEKI